MSSSHRPGIGSKARWRPAGADAHHFCQHRSPMSAHINAIVVRAQRKGQQAPHLLEVALVSLHGLLHTVGQRIAA